MVHTTKRFRFINTLVQTLFRNTINPCYVHLRQVVSLDDWKKTCCPFEALCKVIFQEYSSNKDTTNNQLRDNNIVFENFTALIGDLMVAN